MIKVFIFLIVFIGFIGTTLVTSTLYFSQLIANVNTQNDIVNIENIKNIIKNNILYVNNKMIVPYGTNGNDYHELPNWITFERNNVYGNPYIYCPYSEIEPLSVNNTVLNSDTTTYNVETINNDKTNNKDYVEGSEPSPLDNILAIIISPKNENNLATCNSITYSDGHFRSEAGFVEVVDKNEVLLSDINKSKIENISISTDGQYGLSNNLANWSSSIPLKSVFVLKENETFLFNNSFIYTNDEINKKDLYIKGNSDLNYSIIQGVNSGRTLEFNNVNVNLENISINGNLKLIFNNSKVTSNNSRLANIELNNSELYLKNTELNNFDSTHSYSIEAFNSEIHFIGNNELFNINSGTNIFLNNSELSTYKGTVTNITINGVTDIFELVDSELKFNNSNINVLTTGALMNNAIVADGLSTINIRNSSIDLERGNSFIQSYGKTLIKNSAVSMAFGSNYGIYLLEGSILNLDDSSIGTSGNNIGVGIYDKEAAQLIGDNNNVYASNCAAGTSYSSSITLNFVDDSYDGVNQVATTEDESLSFNVRDYFNKLNLNCF